MDALSVEYAQELIKFLRNSGSPFLACKNLLTILRQHKCIEIHEGDNWDLKTNEGYVLKKENRNICSFFIGKNFNIDNGSILITIGHVDACALKISPNNSIIKSKMHQINVECYGGGLWNTWFDRGLGISGQVLIRQNNKIVEKLIQINKPLIFLPNLAIHLQNRTRFEFSNKINYEQHLKPIISTVMFDRLNRTPLTSAAANTAANNAANNAASTAANANAANATTNTSNIDNTKKNNIKADYDFSQQDELIYNNNNVYKKIISDYSSPLLYAIAKELNCSEKDIIDFELCLMDSQDPCLCGVYNEFIEGPRLDNLVGSFSIFQAFVEFINTIKHDNNDNYKRDGIDRRHNNLYICIGYDHEEIGSLSEVGACTHFTKNVINRILSNVFKEHLNKNQMSIDDIYGRLASRSMLLSVDMAHCNHPNYSETVQVNHALYFHEGIAFKFNASKNYVTSPFHAGLLKSAFKMYEKNDKSCQEPIKFQNFIVKNNSPCGSTVGSILAANLSMPGVDIGIPQLAMHSIREFAGVRDIYYLVKGVLAFYSYYSDVLAVCSYEE